MRERYKSLLNLVQAGKNIPKYKPAAKIDIGEKAVDESCNLMGKMILEIESLRKEVEKLKCQITQI